MITAMFRAMLLTLLNDRGALALAFLLPIIFFLIMAEIFSSATGVNMQLHVAFADETGGERSRRLLDNLRANDGIVAVGGPDLDRQQARELVGKGAADFGLVMRANARRLDDVGGFGSPPILLINDPVRAGMVPMISGQIQKSYFDALPDVALASVIGLIEDQFVELDSEQRIVIDEGLAQMRDEAQAGGATGWTFAEMIETQSVGRQSASRSHVAYYAGAVTCMFLLFSNVQSAISLTEERQSGILERIMAGPGGMAVLVNGKFLFLLANWC